MTERWPQHFADWRDRHRGQTVLVCGCGRSLALLDHPQRFVTIGVNDVGRRFTPDYLVVVNERRQFDPARFAYVERSEARAVFTQLDLGIAHPRVVRFRLGRRGGTDRPDDGTLHFSNNSPFVAVGLARHLGARRIGLIGVDFTEDHFFGATGRHPLAAQIERIDREYGALAAACRAEGVELVNLSPVSRLASLPRARLTPAGDWARAEPPHGPAPGPAPGPSVVRAARPLTVAIENRPATGAIGQLFDALAASARELGHQVLRSSPHAARSPAALAIVWNGRALTGAGPTLYCEHGWLPRSDYQISPRGINADSHAAGFRWQGEPLGAAESAALDAHLARVKAASHGGQYRYMEASGAVPAGLSRAFLLVPLQIETDTNIVRHAPAHLRSMQALIEHVSRVDPPWPVLFKQHPADARTRNAHLRLAPRRPQDRIWPHALGNVHQMLKSGACRGILTINSNVAHDGLLWDVPAIVLGRNVWPAGEGRTPFLTAIPGDWEALAESAASAEAVACRRAYAHHLLRHQWTLAAARDLPRVAALLDALPREALPPARPGRLVAARARPAPAVLNVVAENRRWLFEHWKQALARVGTPGFQVVASARPLPDAAAWVFVRAAEAAATPDPQRTLVQIHDFAAGGAYRRGGARAGVAACAALSLAHPSQLAILEAEGIAAAGRRCLVQPVGWQAATPTAAPAGARPRIAWVGRPAHRDGADISGLPGVLEAARGWAGRVEVVLIGERLEPAAAALRRAGVDARVRGLAQCPIHRAPEWLSGVDALVLTSAADAGPWPIFDALHAGVPVVARPIGWAAELLADGRCGRLAADDDALGPAVLEVIAEREAWRRRRVALRERVAGQSFEAWLRANLTLAAELARPAERQSLRRGQGL